MWIVEVKSIPVHVLMQARNVENPVDADILLRRSSQLLAVGEGRELSLLLGEFSPTLLSADVWLWAAWMPDVHFTRGGLRMLRRVMEWYVRQCGRVVRIEVLNERDARFARFLGFRFEQQRGVRDQYRWAE